MTAAANPIPDGFHTVTASLIVRNAADAIEFYKKALGATEIMRMAGPDGKIGHAELKIGDSIIFLSDEFPDMGCGKSPQTVGAYTGAIYLYVPDVDAAFEKAVNAGAKATMPVTDMFWGDRHGQVVDPFGHAWSISTHTQDYTPEQIEEGAKAWQAQMAQMEKKIA
jgi:PhnB protein